MSERKYLPTFAELVDRLSIVQLKAIFIPEHADEYYREMGLIMHDLDLIRPEMDARSIHAILVIAISNRYIWENEAKARAGGSEQDKLLKLTHSINGVRNTAKNVLAARSGERRDYKVDALAAELHEEFGNWNIFVPMEVPKTEEERMKALLPKVTYVGGPRS
jgi:hypothetical protein